MIETLENYTAIVADYYGIPYDFVFLKFREKELVQVRQMVTAIARELDGFKLRDIGLFFNQDHCTVISSLKKVQNYCYSDKKYRQEYNELLERCRKGDWFYNIENDFHDVIKYKN